MGDDFKIVAVTRLRHGVLHEALKARGWTQTEFARRLGKRDTEVGRWCNIHECPKHLSPEQEKVLLDLTGLLPEDIWPEELRQSPLLKQPKIREQMAEIPRHLLADWCQPQALPMPDDVVESKEQRDRIKIALSTLTPREEKVVRLYFGLGENEHTLAEIAQLLDRSRTRVGQIFSRALRKLKHPIRRLREFSE